MNSQTGSPERSERPLRILALEDSTDAHGGQERAFVDVVKSLTERGHHIDLVYREQGAFLASLTALCGDVYRCKRLLSKPIDLLHPLPAMAAVRWASKRSYDLVYVNNLGLLPMADVLSLRLRVPLVCHARVPPPPRLSSVVGRLTSARVDKYIAVSRMMRDRYIESGVRPQRIEALHIGVDVTLYAPQDAEVRDRVRRDLGIPEDAFVVLYPGRLDREKSVETLIAAFSRLPLGPYEDRLVIAGAARNHPTSAAAAEYEAHLKDLADAKRCLFVPRQLDVVPLYAAADVVALTPSYDEPLARVPLEAMACGVPVVSTAVGGMPEALTDSPATLAPSGDVDAIAHGIADFRGWRIADPGLGQRCRDHVVNNFSLEKEMDGLEDLIWSVSRTSALG